jgi:hypothetical protein
MSDNEAWPELPLAAWRETRETLHMWTQIVGKVRRVLTPWINHSWGVALYVTARGLTTGPMYQGLRALQIDFDFIDHRLVVQSGDGQVRVMALEPRSVAGFHAEVLDQLADIGIRVRIAASPNEVLDPIPFARDETHASYDPVQAERFWRVLLQVQRVFQRFRAGFVGKSSPVHFFWGSFDLALTRFSGRRAPQHPGGVPNCPDWITREAYSHEVSSCGFWPGNDALPTPVFYAYAYPEPEGYAAAAVGPEPAFYNPDFREFMLPYDAVRTAAAPDAALLQFLQDSYERAATLGGWDRTALEADFGTGTR